MQALQAREESRGWLRLWVPDVGQKSLKIIRNPAKQSPCAAWEWPLTWVYEAAMAGQKKSLHRIIDRNQHSWREHFALLWPGVEPHQLRDCTEESAGFAVTTAMLLSILCWTAGALRRVPEDRFRGANFLAVFLDAFFVPEQTPLIVTLPKVDSPGETELRIDSGWVDTSSWLEPARTSTATPEAADFYKLLMDDYQAAARMNLPWLQGSIQRCKVSQLACMLLVDPTRRQGKQAGLRAKVAHHLMRQLATLVDLRASCRMVPAAEVPKAELALKTSAGNLKRNNCDLKARLQEEAQGKKAPMPGIRCLSLFPTCLALGHQNVSYIRSVIKPDAALLRAGRKLTDKLTQSDFLQGSQRERKARGRDLGRGRL